MKMKNLFFYFLSKSDSKKGQNIVEYVVLFTVVAAVVIAAATAIIQPALQSLYARTADSLNRINTTVP